MPRRRRAAAVLRAGGVELVDRWARTPPYSLALTHGHRVSGIGHRWRVLAAFLTDAETSASPESSGCS